MKRKSLIAVMAAIMVLISAVVCFAGTGLQIVSSYPQDGQKNTSMENLGVKIVFNNKVNGKDVQANNKKAVKLVDQDGKSVPIKVLFSNKSGKMMLAVADTNNSDYRVLNNADYKLTIASNFKDNEGNELGKDEVITFKTYNQKANNMVNMGMMVVMFGGLFLVSMKTSNKSKEENDDQEESFNPYKEAKRTGKSLEEVMAEYNKKQEKSAKKKSKKKQEEVYEKKIENCAELLNNVYHVHAPAPTNHEDRSIEALNKMRKAEKAAAKAKKQKKSKRK